MRVFLGPKNCHPAPFYYVLLVVPAHQDEGDEMLEEFERRGITIIHVNNLFIDEHTTMVVVI